MFRVRIFTPQQPRPPLEAEHVTLPAEDGEWGVRTGHMPFVCLLIPGRLEVIGPAGRKLFRIGAGVARIVDDDMEIYVETVDEESAASARERRG